MKTKFRIVLLAAAIAGIIYGGINTFYNPVRVAAQTGQACCRTSADCGGSCTICESSVNGSQSMDCTGNPLDDMGWCITMPPCQCANGGIPCVTGE